MSLQPLQNEISARTINLVNDIRQFRLKTGTIYPHLYLVREDGDPSLRLWFLSHMIEDRFENTYSYPQFLAAIREKVPKVNN